MRHSKTTRFVAMLLILGCLTASCGMLLYPERRGQDSGSIDPVVVILDAQGNVAYAGVGADQKLEAEVARVLRSAGTSGRQGSSR